jgi:hypothetical protein
MDVPRKNVRPSLTGPFLLEHAGLPDYSGASYVVFIAVPSNDIGPEAQRAGGSCS